MQWITAGDGTAHVSSADDGAIYAGIVGTECYVSDIGDKLSCTMQSANTALIGTGLGILNGRWFRVTTPEEVTIESGTQNQRRNDIICAHFETSEDGKEGGGLVVVKGTPTSGTDAEDPEIPTGDILDGATDAYMPLWRIPIDGINAGDPEPLFSVLVPYADFRDSVSQESAEDAVFSLTLSGRTFINRSRRIGRLVFLDFDLDCGSFTAFEEWSIGKAPIPAGGSACGFALIQGTTPFIALAQVDSSGTLTVINKSYSDVAQCNWAFVSMSYVAA